MKRILAVILLCCLLLIGCGQSKTAKPIYELPGISWGDSIEQAEKIFGELTENAADHVDFGKYILQKAAVSGEYEGYAVTYQFGFYLYEGCSYLVSAQTIADTDRMSEEELSAFCVLLEEQFAEMEIVTVLGESLTDYSAPTTDGLDAKQEERYQKNCHALGVSKISNMPLIRISRGTFDVCIYAENWVLANVDIAVE